MSKTDPCILPLAVVCCSLALSSCGSRNNESAPRAASQASPLTVTGVVVQPEPLDNVVRSSGTVLASESVDLVAEAAGRIQRISFREGGHVKKNAVLVNINDDDLQAQLRKVQAQIQLAADQENRQMQLFGKNAISKEQYDIAVSQVTTLKADRDNILATIRKRAVLAPFDGIVGLRYVSVGGYVTSSTRIASIQKVNPLKVDFGIPEKYAGLVSVNDTVLCTSEETKLQFRGRVYGIEPRIDPAMGTLQLRALCENKSERIFPGSFVHIQLQLRQISNALMVPTQAVIPALKGQTLFVRKGGVVASVSVTTGIRTAANVQIIDGLAAGDTVITSGIMQLRPGMPVTVQVK
jgi:membrane fusion protein (multidrug efflux system)